MEIKPIVALLFIGMLVLSGCTIQRKGTPETANALTQSPSDSQDTSGVDGNTCVRQYINCPGGERALTVSCSSGYNYTQACPKTS